MRCNHRGRVRYSTDFCVRPTSQWSAIGELWVWTPTHGSRMLMALRLTILCCIIASTRGEPLLSFIYIFSPSSGYSRRDFGPCWADGWLVWPLTRCRWPMRVVCFESPHVARDCHAGFFANQPLILRHLFPDRFFPWWITLWFLWSPHLLWQTATLINNVSSLKYTIFF